MSTSEPPTKNPPTKETTDSEISDTPSKRTRSQSRRARRRKAQEKKQQMPSLNEDAESSSSPEAKPGALQHIPTDDASSIDGPVAQRGERPLRGGKPGQDRNQNQNQGMKKEGGPSEEMMKQDGLKLRLELNLDIELELKASIRGDITLALLN